MTARFFKPIDVAAIETFDAELISTLTGFLDVIMSYFQSEREREEENEKHSNRFILESNPYAEAYYHLLENVLLDMLRERTVRAWHYTRLTDEELLRFQNVGIELSTPESLKSRIDSLIRSGHLTKALGAKIFEGSPLHGSQFAGRVGRFWTTSHWMHPEDGRVIDLLGYWGGEVASFGDDDPVLRRELRQIGRARILEIAIPLKITKSEWAAARSVVSKFSAAHGVEGDFSAFDISVLRPLDHQAIIGIKSENEDGFATSPK